MLPNNQKNTYGINVWAVHFDKFNSIIMYLFLGNNYLHTNRQ